MEKALDESYGAANVEDQKWLQDLRDVLNQYNVSLSVLHSKVTM